MRSRNGNSYFIWSIYAIIFFNSLVLNASEYLISYRYVVKNAVVYNEYLHISKTMKKCEGKPTDFIDFFVEDNRNIQKIIDSNSQEFIEFIHKIGLFVEHEEVTINAKSSSITILTLKTTCFKVDFNDKFARITSLK